MSDISCAIFQNEMSISFPMILFLFFVKCELDWRIYLSVKEIRINRSKPKPPAQMSGLSKVS